MKYTRDFYIYEFASPDGLVPDYRMDPMFMDRMQVLRDIWNQRIIISSGIRSPEHNITVGGVVNSRHLHGLAADVDLSEYTSNEKWRFFQIVFHLAFPGIGISENFIHLDMRTSYKAVWTY